MDKWFGEKRLWLFGNHLPLLPRRPVQHPPNDPLPVIPSATRSKSEHLSPAVVVCMRLMMNAIYCLKLNDLIRDLHLTKEDTEFLTSRMQQWKHLAFGTKVTIYGDRSLKLAAYFEQKHPILRCTDVDGLFLKMNHPYDKTEWRSFIDSSKYSLKCLLLHNGNEKPSIPIAHAINKKENYESMTKILTLLKYNVVTLRSLVCCANWTLKFSLKNNTL